MGFRWINIFYLYLNNNKYFITQGGLFVRKTWINILKKEFVDLEMNELEIANYIKENSEISAFKFKEIISGRKVIDITTIPIKEQMILKYYQLLLQSIFKIQYPNRTNIMKHFMNIVPFLESYNNYSIYKFDLKNFFPSIDVNKIEEEIKKSDLLYDYEINFLMKYLKENKSLTPGIGLNNCLIEILGNKFDKFLSTCLKNDNIIYYDRYVDDGILIFDEIENKKEIEKKVKKYIHFIFGKKVEVNKNKTKFISKADSFNIEYLGYNFYKNNDNYGTKNKDEIKFGIATKKIDKSRARIKRIIIEFQKDGNFELLKYRLDSIYKRRVYVGKKKNQNTIRWQVRGISQDYKELKKFILNESSVLNVFKEESKKLKKSIQKDLKSIEKIKINEADKIKRINKIIDSKKTILKEKKYKKQFAYIDEKSQNLLTGQIILDIFEEINIAAPIEIQNYVINKRYLSFFLKNKAMLFHKDIGFNKEEVQDMLKKFNLDININTSYENLVKELYKLSII